MMELDKALKGIEHFTEQLESIIPNYYAERINNEMNVDICARLMQERDNKLGEIYAELLQLQDYVQQHSYRPLPPLPIRAKEGKGDKDDKHDRGEEPKQKRRKTDGLLGIEHKLREQDVDDVQRLFAKMSTKEDKGDVQLTDRQKQFHFYLAIEDGDKPDEILLGLLRTTGGVVEVCSLRSLACLSPFVYRAWKADHKKTIYNVPGVQLLVLPLVAEIVRWFTKDEPICNAFVSTAEKEVNYTNPDVYHVDLFFNKFCKFYESRIWTSGGLERYVQAFERAIRILEMPPFLAVEAEHAAKFFIHSRS